MNLAEITGIVAVSLTMIYAVYVLFFARQKSRGFNLGEPTRSEDAVTLDYVNSNHGVMLNGRPMIIKNLTNRP